MKPAAVSGPAAPRLLVKIRSVPLLRVRQTQSMLTMLPAAAKLLFLILMMLSVSLFAQPWTLPENSWKPTAEPFRVPCRSTVALLPPAPLTLLKALVAKVSRVMRTLTCVLSPFLGPVARLTLLTLLNAEPRTNVPTWVALLVCSSTLPLP